MRPLPRALGGLLAAVLVVGVLLPGGATAQDPGTAQVPTCHDLFEIAEAVLEATDAVRASAGPGAGPSDNDRAALATALIDGTIRSCDGRTTWLIVAAAHAQVLDGADAPTVLFQRCTDPAAGLDGAAACDDLVEPSPSAAPRLVKLPSIKPKVKGAQRTRYYSIEGLSPDELFTQMQVKGSEPCPTHAVACTLIQPRIQPYVTTGSSCRVTRIRAGLTSTAWIPTWTSPKQVYPELVAWWRTVVTRVAKHEAEHIRIAQRYLAKLKKEIIGKSCASLNAYAARWSKQLTAAQDAFDRKEADRPWPEYDGPLPPGIG